MHGQRFLLRALHYSSDGTNLFRRLDLEEMTAATRVCLNFESVSWNIEIDGASASLVEDAAGVEIAFRKILEVRAALSSLGCHPGDLVKLQLSLWQDALPLDALPQEGWLRLSTAEPGDWPPNVAPALSRPPSHLPHLRPSAFTSRLN